MAESVPIKLLHEAAEFEVQVELVSGDKYRGILHVIEDNMNCWLRNVVHTSTSGEIEQIESAYLRGSSILYVSIPEMFADSRLFKTDFSDLRSLKHTGKVKRKFMTVGAPRKGK